MLVSKSIRRNFAKKMMDFEKLKVYQKAKAFYRIVLEEIINKDVLDRISRDQLRRAALSIPLNIAEGCSRFSKADRRNFFVIARGSTYECVSALDLIKCDGKISNDLYDLLYFRGEEISKMLYTLEKSLK